MLVENGAVINDKVMMENQIWPLLIACRHGFFHITQVLLGGVAEVVSRISYFICILNDSFIIYILGN